MATSTDEAGVAPDQEHRTTLRDPIRESEGLYFLRLVSIKIVSI